jgi:predicted N-acetyltransferase YhbS
VFQTIFHVAPLSAYRLHVDAVAVHPAAQGGGVGSAMVRFVLEEAARRGKLAVTLYCIDRNEGARRLYRRLGFVVSRHERLGALRPILGFAATDLMRAEVAADVDGEPAGIVDATARRDPGGAAQVSRNGAGTRLV